MYVFRAFLEVIFWKWSPRQRNFKTLFSPFSHRQEKTYSWHTHKALTVLCVLWTSYHHVYDGCWPGCCLAVCNFLFNNIFVVIMSMCSSTRICYGLYYSSINHSGCINRVQVQHRRFFFYLVRTCGCSSQGKLFLYKNCRFNVLKSKL